jgi:zinc/manganese transport system substrate-binding protein
MSHQSWSRWNRILGGVLGALVLTVMGTGAAEAKLRVVASITDLASIVASVGGDRIEVQAIARPTADVHHVEVLPSYMVRVSRAQLYLKVGMDLDQWADAIIDGSHNPDLMIVDCSEGIDVLEKPTAKVNASMGDIHPLGNPHYWLDPRNGAIVGHTIAQALGRLDPEHAGEYEARAEALAQQIRACFDASVQQLAALPSRDLITYHASWPYFAHAFDLTIVATLEPIPGIPPTGRHLQDLVDLARQDKIRVVLQEPYFSDEAADFLRRETGVRVAKVSPSCAETTAGSYLAHMVELVDVVAGVPQP